MKKVKSTLVRVDADLNKILTKMKRGKESVNDVIFSLVGNRREDVGFSDAIISTSGVLTNSRRNVNNVNTFFDDVNHVNTIVGVLAVLGVFSVLMAYLFLHKK